MLQCSPVPFIKRLKPLGFYSVILVAVVACTSAPTMRCSSEEQPVVLDTLYFGTAKPGGTVTTEEWTAFVDYMVVREFPEGLTSWAAAGRWGNSAGLVEREPSYLLQLAHNGSQEKDRAVQRIIHRYKSDFHQEAVMRIRSQACRTF